MSLGTLVMDSPADNTSGCDDDGWGDGTDDQILANIDLSLDKYRNLVYKESTETSSVRESKCILLSELLPGDISPLERLRHGYLWVSDITSQSWCEHQMVYKLALPDAVEKSSAMRAGSDLHLARELEVQDYVQVKTTSNEDIFAVKVINLMTSARQLISGQAVCREIPIFGVPFGSSIFFMGVIDEIRTDKNTMELELVELKTRVTKSIPTLQQQTSHKLQTMMYKILFDDLVKGILTKNVIASTLKLDLEKPLGSDVLDHILGRDSEPRKDLNALLDALFDTVQSLTCIQGILLEYCSQHDGSTIAVQNVEYDETWFKSTFDNLVSFWKGLRKPTGVDIEEAWKCQRCEFADVCEWRSQKSLECAAKNTAIRH